MCMFPFAEESIEGRTEASSGTGDAAHLLLWPVGLMG